MPGQSEAERRQAGGDVRLEDLQAENEQLRATLERKEAEIAGLRQRLEELERRVGLNSSNSGKPPSSDGPAKPPAQQRTKSQRGRSGKRSGGQRGHKGSTLRQTDSPDRIQTHLPPSCDACSAPLAAADTQGEPLRRQVFDLPAPQPPVVTEHQAFACRCGSCGRVTRAAFPEGVGAPVQYGPRIAAVAVYLQNGHFLPEERLAEVFQDLFGVAVCSATLAGMTRKAAERWRSCSERVRDMIVSLDGAKHLDETGFRIGGKTQWLHVISTRWLTFYRTSPRRGSLLEGLRGILVHDHWKPYFTVRDVLHSLCNAHHLRELQALVEIDREDWARRMQLLLRRANRAVRMALERGIPLPRAAHAPDPALDNCRVVVACLKHARPTLHCGDPLALRGRGDPAGAADAGWRHQPERVRPARVPGVRFREQSRPAAGGELPEGLAQSAQRGTHRFAGPAPWRPRR